MFVLPYNFSFRRFLPASLLGLFILLLGLTVYRKPWDSAISIGIMAAGLPAYIFGVSWKSKPRWLRNGIGECQRLLAVTRRHFNRMPTARFPTVRVSWSEQVRTCRGSWGAWDRGPVQVPAKTDRQTDTTENITFPQLSLAVGNKYTRDVPLKGIHTWSR